MKTRVVHASLAVFIMVLAAPSVRGEALSGGAGDLLVAPTRVVLEGATRSASLMLRNAGTRAALYRLAFEDAEMDERGTVRVVGSRTVEEGASAPLVQFSPRQVLLEPGATQVVRMSVRKPAGLPAGEYRSHLTIRAVPSERPADAPAGTQGWSVQLTALYGVSVPVIVRHGATEATVEIVEARWLAASEGRPERVEVSLQREGTRSVYGDLSIVADGRKDGVTVGRARGVAVWTPNRRRTIAVPLSEPATGPLKVTYQAGGMQETVTAPVRR